MSGGADEFPRTTQALRAVLAAHGIRPAKQKHGQCFLTDPQAVDAVVRDAAIEPADHVVEVGTGPGLLTHALCETGARVTTFEVDARLLELATTLRDWPERVRFVREDVLAGKHELAAAFALALGEHPEPPGRRLLVSNLPYSAATPILMGVLSMADPPDRLVVMVQLEVAQKMLSGPGPAEYGAPSIQVGLKAAGRLLRRFGPKVFWPRPRVHSAVVELLPRRPPLLAPDEQRPFATFVTTLFTRRRKVLVTGLRTAARGLGADDAKAVLAALDLAPTARVQELDPEQVLALWRAVRDR